VDYLNALGLEAVRDHTQRLTEQCVAALETIAGLTVHGPRSGRLGPVAFSLAGTHPHDIATLLDGEGVAGRAGRHCSHPLRSRLGAPSPARASFYVTNQSDDIDRLVAGLAVVQSIFGVA